MIEYPKIETLYDRDPATFRVTDLVRLPEFLLVKHWLVTEKIDGTNIRVELTPDGVVHFGGRTENAQLPAPLLDILRETFTPEKMIPAFEPESHGTLFGEGYGAKIQKGGGNYRPSPSFRLFDVLVGDWWLNWENVRDIAFKLAIPTVPVINPCAQLEQITPIVMALFSEVAQQESDLESRHDVKAEGVVCRTDPLLFTRRGHRLMFKLKAADYTGGKK